jgi:hypothetical protein
MCPPLLAGGHLLADPLLAWYPGPFLCLQWVVNSRPTVHLASARLDAGGLLRCLHRQRHNQPIVDDRAAEGPGHVHGGAHPRLCLPPAGQPDCGPAAADRPAAGQHGADQFHRGCGCEQDDCHAAHRPQPAPGMLQPFLYVFKFWTPSGYGQIRH